KGEYLRRIFRRRARWFLADLFLNFPAPSCGKKWTHDPVKKIEKKNYGRHPLIEFYRHGDEPDHKKKARDRLFGAPVDRLEAGIAELTEHHKGEQQHQEWQHVFPFTDRALAFVEPEQEQCNRCDHAGSGRDREAGEVFIRTDVSAIRGHAIESS